MELWIAVINDFDGKDQVQACRTPESAMRWLAATIPADEWASFIDALPASESRQPSRVISDNPAEIVLDWWGGRNYDEGPYEWGNDVFSMRIVEQEIVD